MNATQLEEGELERRLAELHAASFGWACACCQWNEMEAEDVLQSTYVKVISGRALFEGRSSFRTWLFGVIRRTALERVRKRRSEDRRVEGMSRELKVSGGELPTPERDLEQKELAQILRARLEELPERQKEVMNLVFYHDLTIREAAEVMQVSIGSARVHYDRGKKKLRTLLHDVRGREGS